MTTLLKTLLTVALLGISFTSWAEGEAGAKKTLYYTIEEPFTINFYNQSKKRARYLQIKVALSSKDQKVIDSAEQNLPMIQDALLELFSQQDYETTTSVQGRKQLQEQALDTVKRILEEETGSDAIESVYFTGFILQ